MDLLPEDVAPVKGEEAKQYQAVIVEGVGKQFGGDEAKLADFIGKTRDYGKGTLEAAAFWTYLSGAFGENRALVFLPKLARLVPDETRRKALLGAPKIAKALKHNEGLKAAAEPASAAEAAAAPRFPAGAAAATAALVGDGFDAPPPTRPPGGGGGGGGMPPFAARPKGEVVDPSSLSPDARQVHEMFPALPISCILHALQEAPVQAVIEKALAGRIDPNAVPKPADPQKLQAGRSGPRLLSGKMCRVGEAMGGRFPPDALPSHMLPRDLAKLQDLFPTAPTAILQAELQVTGSAQFAMDTLMTDQIHQEVLDLDPVPVALRGYLVKSDPGGRNFTRRFFILRQLTGSLCYAKLPEDMDDPLGVIYLFGCRLSAAPPDAKAQCMNRFPACDGGSGWSLVTPHRTYHLFAESAAEAAAWKAVLTQMAMLMVPAEFETGDDVVECEVFENETYALMAGWGAPGFVGQRLKYSNRKGELSSEEFPEVKLPGDFKWETEWRVDKTYTTCDADGWSYATTFSRVEQDLERGESSGANSTFDLVRRRRWVRSSRRLDPSLVPKRGYHPAKAPIARSDPDSHLVDFGQAQAGASKQAAIPEESPSITEFSREDDPFADDGL